MDLLSMVGALAMYCNQPQVICTIPPDTAALIK